MEMVTFIILSIFKVPFWQFHKHAQSPTRWHIPLAAISKPNSILHGSTEHSRELTKRNKHKAKINEEKQLKEQKKCWLCTHLFVKWHQFKPCNVKNTALGKEYSEIYFYFSSKNICCTYLLEVSRRDRDASNEYPKHVFMET